MSSNEMQAPAVPAQRHMEGVTVIGEAVRRVTAEGAEFLIEVTVSAPTAAQALRDNHMKTTQVAHVVAALGVQPSDLQSISLDVYTLYSPLMQSLPPAYGTVPQLPQHTGGVQSEVQFGVYQARNTLRVSVREPGRVGEIVDAAGRAGANVLGAFCFKVNDESRARQAALEAAGRDARAKAEALATAAGRQVGEPIAISEDVIASNGAYAALRSAVPFAFGAGAPQVVGELEYYARVSASFRFSNNKIA
jgi:uncharacterized protein YggE